MRSAAGSTCRIAALAFLAVSGFGQNQQECFAFLLRADISVVCGGKTVQVTHRGNIERFVVSDEPPSLAYTTSRITRRSATTTSSQFTTTIVNLASGAVNTVGGSRSVVSTCGGILPMEDAERSGSGTHDLLTGKEVMTGGYNWFRCSSDRKIVVGTMKQAGDDLRSDGIKVAPGGDFSVYQFDISPDGSHVAYYGDRHALCEFSFRNGTECADRGGTADLPSVNGSGGVLVAVGTGQGCYYKAPYDFSLRQTPGTTEDECLGIGYWKPGFKSIQIIQPLGRDPHWIEPQTAGLLEAWATHLAVKPQK
jgi:hypothetical protein